LRCESLDVVIVLRPMSLMGEGQLEWMMRGCCHWRIKFHTAHVMPGIGCPFYDRSRHCGMLCAVVVLYWRCEINTSVKSGIGCLDGNHWSFEKHIAMRREEHSAKLDSIPFDDPRNGNNLWTKKRPQTNRKYLDLPVFRLRFILSHANTAPCSSSRLPNLMIMLLN
jgi:hypothetical protein